VDTVLRIQNECGNEIAQFFEDAHEHQRSEADRIRRNDEKNELPGQRDSRKSVIKERMRDRRRILLANLVEDEKQRRQDQNAPDAGDVEKNFGEFHARSVEEEI